MTLTVDLCWKCCLLGVGKVIWPVNNCSDSTWCFPVDSIGRTRRKVNIGNCCDNFHLQTSTAGVIVKAKVAQFMVDGCIMYRHWADAFFSS